MQLSEYIDSGDRGTQAALARDINAQSQLVWQWARGVRAVPVVRCAAIERATSGAVRRWDLRPADWHVHWPELIGAEGAPAAPLSATAQPSGFGGLEKA